MPLAGVLVIASIHPFHALLGCIEVRRKAEDCSEGAQKAPSTIPTSAEMTAYANSAHAHHSAAPPTHITNITTGAGKFRNHSKASPIPPDALAVVLLLVVGFSLVLPIVGPRSMPPSCACLINSIVPHSGQPLSCFCSLSLLRATHGGVLA